MPTSASRPCRSRSTLGTELHLVSTIRDQSLGETLSLLDFHHPGAQVVEFRVELLGNLRGAGSRQFTADASTDRLADGTVRNDHQRDQRSDPDRDCIAAEPLSRHHQPEQQSEYGRSTGEVQVTDSVGTIARYHRL